jgi:hypothetical protein
MFDSPFSRYTRNHAMEAGRTSAFGEHRAQVQAADGKTWRRLQDVSRGASA